MTNSQAFFTPPAPEQLAQNFQFNEVRKKLMERMEKIQEEYKKLHSHLERAASRKKYRHIQLVLIILFNLAKEVEILWQAFESHNQNFRDMDRLNAFLLLTDNKNFSKERLVRIATQFSSNRSDILEKKDPHNSMLVNIKLWKVRLRQYQTGDYNFVTYSDLAKEEAPR